MSRDCLGGIIFDYGVLRVAGFIGFFAYHEAQQPNIVKPTSEPIVFSAFALVRSELWPPRFENHQGFNAL